MANLYGPRIVTDGLVFNMDFSNPKCYSGTGSYCYDLSGNNFQGELVNTPTYTTDGNNKFFAFATNDYIRVLNSTILDTQTPSVEVWFKTNATTQNGFFFEKGTVNTQYSLFQESVNIVWRHKTSSTLRSHYLGTASSGINITNWFHLVGTFSAGVKRLYLNGILKSTMNDTSYNTINTNTGGMSIGAYGGYAGSRSYYYNGNIAIVKVYNKTLSADDIAQNYNALKGRFGR
jgi:hypothetical protein